MIDCLDDGFDEEHCWELEINQCKDNEYRCTNGQCIPQSFYQDGSNSPDCMDSSDEPAKEISKRKYCQKLDPEAAPCSDVSCQLETDISFCVDSRQYLLIEAMDSSNDSLTSEKCWSGFKCILNFINFRYPLPDDLYKYDECINNIQNNCTDMIYFSTVPILFGNLYLAYKK
jgi:hypothetical protein